MRRLALTVHIAAVFLWLGFLTAAGLAAAVAFPAMKSLGVLAPDFSVPKAEHWLIVGGHFAAPMFRAHDFASMVLGAVALISFLFCLRDDNAAGSRRASRIHAGVLGVSLGLAVFQLVILGPRLRSNLDEYWSDARAGSTMSASAARGRFDADHPVASRTLGALAVGLLVTGIVAGRRLWIA